MHQGNPFFVPIFGKMKFINYVIYLVAFLIVTGFKNHNTQPFGTAVLTEMNVVYEGIDNPLAIRTPGYSQSEISLKVEGAILKSQTPGRYNLRAKHGAKKCSIKIYVKVDNTLRLIGGEYFRIRKLPTPIAQLGGIPNNGLPQSKAVVAAQINLLSTYGPGFAYNLMNRITAYKAKVITAESVYAFQNEGSYIKSEMREVIKKHSRAI